jgi:hypothetical protein
MPSSLAADMARAGLRPLFERTDRPQGLTRADAKEVLDGALMATELIGVYWKHAQQLMNRGVERATLAAAVSDLADLIEHCARALAKVLAQASPLALATHEVDVLDQAVQATKKMGEAVAKQLRWLTSPLPPVDPAVLRPGSARPDSEGFVSLDEFAGRLRSRNSASAAPAGGGA